MMLQQTPIVGEGQARTAVQEEGGQEEVNYIIGGDSLRRELQPGERRGGGGVMVMVMVKGVRMEKFHVPHSPSCPSPPTPKLPPCPCPHEGV